MFAAPIDMDAAVPIGKNNRRDQQEVKYKMN